MSTPLYSTDIIPMTSRPTLTVMDDGDYFVILDTSTGKISKILKTSIMTALKITYDNTTSGLTADTVQAALDELVVNLGSSDSAILALSGRLDTLEGTGEGSVEKAIDDAVSPLAEVVDTNRLYSDSQYLELKAKSDSLQVKCNTLQAEVYTDDPILQYGVVEIIGDGYEADDTPIDVSANVVDGNLDMEQKGLTIHNLLGNSNFQLDSNADGLADNITVKANITTYSFQQGAQTITLRNFTATGSNHVFFDDVLFDDAEIDTSGTWFFRALVKNNEVDSRTFQLGRGFYAIKSESVASGETKLITFVGTVPNASSNVDRTKLVFGCLTENSSFTLYNVSAYNLTALGLDHITDTNILAKLLPYVDGTKSVGKMGVQILDADDNVTQTIFLPTIGNSLPNGVADSVKTVSDGWEHSKRVSTPASVASGVAVNTTNYPTVKNAGQWVNELTSGGTEIGVVGTDSTTGAGMLRFELATPIVTKYDLPHLTSGKTIHRFAGEEKIALYSTGVTFSENVLSVLSAVKFVAGVMTDITSLATITTNTVTFSGINATDVVYVKVEHDVDRPLGILEHTPTVSNTASRLASLEARVSALEV